MIIAKNKAELIFMINLSLLSVVVVSILVDTTVTMKVFYGILSFILTFSIFTLLIFERAQISINLKGLLLNNQLQKNAMYFALAFLASISILTTSSPNLNIDAASIWNGLVSLSTLSIIRVIAAFYLTCIFPGAVIHANFFKKYELNFVERTGLVILLSYCFTVISGLILLYFNIFSNFNVILSILLSISAIELLNRFRQRGNLAVPNNNVFSINAESIALLVAAAIVIALSYIQVLSIAPLNGIVGGDVPTYMVDANRFVFSKIFGWAPYIWSSFFYWTTSSLAGIPMLYVYSILQFFQIVLVSSLYFFIRTIFPEHKKIAAIATFATFFIAGIGSWLLMNQMVSTTLFGGVNSNTIGILSALFQYTGSSGQTPLALSVFAFDFGLVFFAMAFTCRSIVKGSSGLVDYLVPAVFIAAAIFTHNINIVLIFFFFIFVTFFMFKSKKYLTKLFCLILLFLLLFDPITKWYLTNMIIGILPNLGSLVTIFNIKNIITVALAAIAIILTGFFVFNAKKSPDYSSLSSNIRSAMTRRTVKTFFVFLGILSFILAVILYFANFGVFQYTQMWLQLGFVFPWYYVICRTFGIVFPFAIASIPLLFKIKKNSLNLIFCFLFAITLPMILSIALPNIFYPSLIFNRYSAYLLFPLSILAALSLIELARVVKRNTKVRILGFIVLTVIFASSFVSQVYARELYIANGKSPMISSDESLALNWINSNISKASRILPLTDYSETILSNLASGVQVLPNFGLWWTKNVILKSEPEVVLYSISGLNVDYLFVRKGELTALSGGNQSYFESTVSSFPIIYQNNEVTIYRVPIFPIYVDSHFILVKSSYNTDESSLAAAFSFLMSSGIKFAIANSADLTDLKPGYTYLFTSNVTTQMTTEQIREYITQGAKVISIDRTFVSQILNINYPKDMLSTNSLDGWALEQDAKGQLAVSNGILPSSFIFGQNASSGNNGLYIYQYASVPSLNLGHVDSIKLWFKTNVTGNLYFGLLNDPANFGVWYGKYDARYQIGLDEINKWVQVELPVAEPSIVTSNFKMSNISYIRVGIDGLTSNQSVEFSVGDIQTSEKIKGVNFEDGTSFSLSVQNYETNIPAFGEMLASYSLEDGSDIPYLEQTQIGTGSLFFINAIPLVENQEAKGRGPILIHTGSILGGQVNANISFKEKWNLPLFDDLFDDITFARFQMLFNLTNFSGKMMWHSNVNVFGEVKIDSNSIYLANEQLPIETMSVLRNNETLEFKNVTLHNAVFTGGGSLSLKASNTTIASSSAGTYTVIHINGSNDCTINLSNATVTFQSDTNDGVQLFSLNNVNVTVKLQQPIELFMESKQPLLQITGSASGVMQGLLNYGGKQYLFDQKMTELLGRFNLEIAYSSNVLFSEINQVDELKITSSS